MIEPIRFARLACIAVVALAPLASLAQNVAIVNGKPVPKARVDLLLTQAAKGGQQRSPELETTRPRGSRAARNLFAGGREDAASRPAPTTVRNSSWCGRPC